MYVYSRGLNRLRRAGRLAGHVLVAVMPITAFGRALALCPRTHPANGHPGRAHPRQKSWARQSPAADFVLLTVCGLTAWETQFLELTCAVGIPSCHDAIGRGLSHSALQAWAPSHQPCQSPPQPEPAWQLAPGWPNWTGREDVGSPANNTRPPGSQFVPGSKVRAWT